MCDLQSGLLRFNPSSRFKGLLRWLQWLTHVTIVAPSSVDFVTGVAQFPAPCLMGLLISDAPPLAKCSMYVSVCFFRGLITGNSERYPSLSTFQPGVVVAFCDLQMVFRV